MPKNKLSAIALTVGIFVVNSAFAQVERLPGVVDKALPDTSIPQSHSLDKAPSSPLEEAPEVKRNTGNKSITNLKSVVFTGNTVVSTEKLQSVVSKYVGKVLTEADLAELKYDVKKAFYDRGYILVRVVTPPQKFSNGVLNVSIYEAKIGEVTVKEGGALHSGIAKSMSKRTTSGDIVKDTQVESMISDLNDLNDIKASVNLKPGKQLSTTDLDVTLRKENEDVNTASVNNYGSDLTGRVVAGAHLEQSDLLNLGEKFSVDVRRSEEDLWDAGIGLVTPIGFRNLMLETSYLHSENEIGGRLEALKASGESNIANVALSSKLINTRSSVATLRFGFEDRVHESFLANTEDTKDNIRKLYVEQSYLYRAANSVFYGSAKLSRGVDILGASERGESSATRARGNQEAWIFEPLFIANIRPFSENGTIKALVRGQLSSGTLLSSDLFTSGGYGSVRGFEVAQEAAEDGYNFTLEYNHVLPIQVENVTFKAGPFLDGAAISNRVQGSVQDTHLYSAGLGLETTAKLVPVGDTVLRLDWAHPLGTYVSDRVSDDTFYFNLKQNF